MPVKQVYGKKSKTASAYGSSKAFAWSSPTKESSSINDIYEEPLNGIAAALANVSLIDKETKIQNYGSKRQALGQKDGNALCHQPQVALQSKGAKDADQAVRRSPRLAKRHESPHTRSETENSPTRESRLSVHLEQTPILQPTPRRNLKLNRQDSAITPDKDDHANIRPLLDLVTDTVCKNAPVPFDAYTQDIELDFTVSKIAEATFAQVFLLTRKCPTGIANEDQSILKIISLNPTATCPDVPDGRPVKVKETSSDVAKVASEVKLLDYMTEIPGFTNLREMRVLQGQPTGAFVSAWKSWNKPRSKKDKSFFPDPSRKANYSQDQLWAVIEMDHAGFDLEHPDTKIDSIWKLWDVFWGVAIALAKGEEDVEFEHRDLHLGNVCVTMASGSTAGNSCQRHCKSKFGFSGLETTIIDYTLSRAEMKMGRTPPTSETVYIDLEQEGIFDGDASEHYQYDVYRFMRSTVFLGDPKADFSEHDDNTKTSWRQSHLGTNLLWLHYLLHELRPKVPDIDKTSVCQCKEEEQDSGDQVMFMETALCEVVQLLSLESWTDHVLTSASDLIMLALEKEWLNPDDISGDRGSPATLTSKLSRLGIDDEN